MIPDEEGGTANSQGDGFDRVHGTGQPVSRPLGSPKRKSGGAIEETWTTVPGRPWLEQSNHTPPRLRTKEDPMSKGYR